MKKILFTSIYLLTPTILTISSKYYRHIQLAWLFDILIYVVTMVGIVLFFKFKPCNFLALLLGLILPLFLFIHEYWKYPNFLRYIDIYIFIIGYAVPFALISTIVFIIIRRKNKRKAVNFNQTDEQEKVN